MTRLIIFDFSGTLGYYDAAEHEKVFEKLREFGLPENSQRQIDDLQKALPEYFCAATSWDGLVNKITQKLGIVLEADRRDALAVFLQRKTLCKLFDDAREAIGLPQDKAILSLSSKFAIESIPELRHFEVFSPDVIGVAKPDKKAFLAVMKAMKASPEQTVMAGDSLENDILPALELGIKPILIDRKRDIEIDNPKIVKISSLKELKKYL